MTSFFSKLNQAYIIAEIGVNHNGNLDIAKKMIDAAKSAGADAVKFQTFSAESLVSEGTPKVKYQESTTSFSETHFEMIKRLELSYQDHHILKSYCVDKKIDFLSTPYDIESAKFLNELGVKFFKTASADLVDLPLQTYIASTKKPTIIATGMASLGEIEKVVDIYEESNNQDIVLLHCVSNYPCSDSSLNLRAIKTIASTFSLPVGYSDHSNGYLAAAISVAFGAKVVEKHFTLDKYMDGPDHKASSTPEEFRCLVDAVRRVEVMLGSHRKSCQTEERGMLEVSRKSIFLKRSMVAGEIFTSDDLNLKRPGDGIEPIFLSKILGKKISCSQDAGYKLTWSDIE